MKITNLVVSGLFVVFAVLQFDDPDPAFWVALYGGIAAVSVLAAFRKYFVWVVLLGLVVVAYELFKLFPAFMEWIRDGMPSITGAMEDESMYIELIREFLGLVICLAALIFLYIQARRASIQAVKS